MKEVTISYCGGGYNREISVVLNGNNTRIIIDTSIIKNNRGTDTGGVYIEDLASLYVKNTTFLNNGWYYENAIS